MNVKKMIFGVMVLSLLMSCNDSSPVVHNLLEFHNCRVTKVWSVAGCMCSMAVDGSTVYAFDNINKYDSDGRLETSAKEYLMVIFTTEVSDTSLFYPVSANVPSYWMRDSGFVESEGIEYIEEQLSQSYRLGEEQHQTEKAGICLKRIEYRTNGITNLNIFSTSTLWGEKPGNELNEYFKITYYDPSAIIELESHQLLYGFTDVDDMPQSIDEYISLNPLAPPSIRLMFNEAPSELPCNVKFFVEMTTSDGDVLSDSTQIVHITKND